MDILKQRKQELQKQIDKLNHEMREIEIAQDVLGRYKPTEVPVEHTNTKEPFSKPAHLPSWREMILTVMVGPICSTMHRDEIVEAINYRYSTALPHNQVTLNIMQGIKAGWLRESGPRRYALGAKARL